MKYEKLYTRQVNMQLTPFNMAANLHVSVHIRKNGKVVRKLIRVKRKC